MRWELDAPSERLEQLYAESDAFVMPSYHEGFCMPLIEALSHGLPLIHSDRGAIPETSGGLGFDLRAPDSPKNWRAAWSVFLEESARTMVPTDRGVLAREEWLGQVSRHLENYTFQSFYDALVPHLDDLMTPVPAQVKTYLSRAWLDTMARAGRPEIQQTRSSPLVSSESAHRGRRHHDLGRRRRAEQAGRALSTRQGIEAGEIEGTHQADPGHRCRRCATQTPVGPAHPPL